MPSVHLDFTPPLSPDITILRIYESDNIVGPFNLIEEITPVGDFPGYLSEYTTDLANSVDNWFSVSWVDSKGAETNLSNPVQGGALLLVGSIVGRVKLRDSTVNENVARQEAEAAIFQYYGQDPYTFFENDASYIVRRGLTLLTLGRCHLFDISEGGEKYTAGLVSQETTNARTLKSVQDLIHEAERDLGLSYSAIMQMAENEIVDMDGFVDIDQSRLLLVEVR
jgi:hypothetical protein